MISIVPAALIILFQFGFLTETLAVFAMLIAYLMTRHEKWGEAKIRLLAVDSYKEAVQSAESLKAMLREVRI